MIFWTADVLTLPSKRNVKTKRQNVRNLYAKPYPGHHLFFDRHIQGRAYEGRSHESNRVLYGDKAVKDALAEDAIDLDVATLLRDEPASSFASFVSGLRRRGAL